MQLWKEKSDNYRRKNGKRENRRTVERRTKGEIHREEKMNIKKNTKESYQWIASLFVLICGIVMVFLNLYQVPIGKIDSSVLGAFGMFLGFVGAVWQIDLKYDYKNKELEHRLERHDHMHGTRAEETEEEFDVDRI